MPYIYVLGMDGKPQMPTKRRRHVQKLLDTGRARIAGHVPFTIQLRYKNDPVLQPVMLAVDPGRSNIGLAALSQKGELLFFRRRRDQEQGDSKTDGKTPPVPQGLSEWGTKSTPAAGEEVRDGHPGRDEDAEAPAVRGGQVHHL